MSLFGFGSNPSVTVEVTGEGSRPRTSVKSRGTGAEKDFAVFAGDSPISGRVVVSVPPGKKLDHNGIRVELVGQVTMLYERSSSNTFTSLVRDLQPASVLESDQAFNFDFGQAEKPFESYYGMNVQLRYVVRATVARSYQSNLVEENEFVVHIPQEPPNTNPPIKMEVGIEDCLHIEFEYDRNKFHLSDCIEGRVYFLLVRIKIKTMEIAIIRRESAGTGSTTVNESETITKFEVMDGVPVRGEIVPIRLYLDPLPLTQTYRSVANMFSVRYYLNLVLVDAEDRRYFKQQEIGIYRD